MNEEGYVLGNRAAAAWTRTNFDKKHTIINVNDVSDDYYDNLKLLDHEDQHKISHYKNKKMGESSDPLVHFNVEYNSYNKYKDKLSSTSTGHDFTKFLLSSYIEDQKNKGADGSKTLKKMITQYEKNFGKYEKHKDL